MSSAASNTAGGGSLGNRIGGGNANRAAPAVQEPAPLMSRRKLDDLLRQIDPEEKLDPAVEQVLTSSLVFLKKWSLIVRSSACSRLQMILYKMWPPLALSWPNTADRRRSSRRISRSTLNGTGILRFPVSPKTSDDDEPGEITSFKKVNTPHLGNENSVGTQGLYDADSNMRVQRIMYISI